MGPGANEECGSHIYITDTAGGILDDYVAYGHVYSIYFFVKFLDSAMFC